MACPPACDSIAEAAEEYCKELVIHILPDIPLEPSEWPECCIYKVPEQLRKVNGEAYTPKLVSIGPFHHGKDDLKDMEKHKQRYLMDFLFRTQKSQKDLKDNDKILLALLKIIEENEIKIRHCYSEDCSLNSKDFVKMILLDAIFIIELFLKDKEEKEEEENCSEKKSDYIFSKPWLGNGILRDLILLENQLPFFVLEELYRFALGDTFSCNNREEGQQMKQEDLKTLSHNYFEWYDQQRQSTFDEVKHFTDLLRYLFCPPKMEQHWKSIMGKEKESSGTRRSQEKSPDSSKEQKEESFVTRFCATKLNNAGLKFKVKIDGCLLDIQLAGVLGRFPCRGFMCIPCLMKCLLGITRPGCFRLPMHILKVPKLVIDDDTETVFRNLMALEQCHYPSQTYVCSYVLLLDRLVDTDKDVDLLVHQKVIENQLGSNAEVATLINKLGVQIVETSSSHFKNIAQQLNEHYEYPLNHAIATLKREYFPNIFRGTATCVGLIVLGFTFWNFLRPFVV